jgi:hypothetical protein
MKQVAKFVHIEIGPVIFILVFTLRDYNQIFYILQSSISIWTYFIGNKTKQQGLKAKGDIFARTKNIFNPNINVFKYQQTAHSNTCGFLQWRVLQDEGDHMSEDMSKMLHTYHNKNQINNNISYKKKFVFIKKNHYTSFTTFQNYQSWKVPMRPRS